MKNSNFKNKEIKKNTYFNFKYCKIEIRTKFYKKDIRDVLLRSSFPGSRPCGKII